jgi:hypothetical protein
MKRVVRNAIRAASRNVEPHFRQLVKERIWQQRKLRRKVGEGNDPRGKNTQVEIRAAARRLGHERPTGALATAAKTEAE